MSVQRAQYEITSTEFNDWNIYLNEAAKNPTRQDILLANIALECRRSYVKNPWNIKLKAFLKMFDMPKSKKKTWKEKASQAKGFFSSLASAYGKKKRKR
jgi:hypothetical protein